MDEEEKFRFAVMDDSHPDWLIGNRNHYGTMEDAKAILERTKIQNPEKHWKWTIFKLVPINGN